MNIIADTHTHTLLSGHAYSTITENLHYCAQIKMPFLACTDHTGAMPDAPFHYHFSNQTQLPDELFGVYLLRGCEVNILDDSGALDLPDALLQQLELVVASMHLPIYPPADVAAHTNAWMHVAENPHVDIIGHSGDGRYPFVHAAAIKAFAKYDKVVEINAHSFSARPQSSENCRNIALQCKAHGVRVVVSSDAHYFTRIGAFEPAIQMLEEIAFPEELILNADYDRFAAFMHEKCGRDFPRTSLTNQEI